jgi:hypothetical protein
MLSKNYRQLGFGVMKPLGGQAALLKEMHARVAQNFLDPNHPKVDLVAIRPHVVGWNTGIVGWVVPETLSDVSQRWSKPSRGRGFRRWSRSRARTPSYRGPTFDFMTDDGLTRAGLIITGHFWTCSSVAVFVFLTRSDAGVEEGEYIFHAPNGDSRAQFQRLRETTILDAGPPRAFRNRNRTPRCQNGAEADEPTGWQM